MGPSAAKETANRGAANRGVATEERRTGSKGAAPQCASETELSSNLAFVSKHAKGGLASSNTTETLKPYLASGAAERMASDFDKAVVLCKYCANGANSSADTIERITASSR